MNTIIIRKYLYLGYRVNTKSNAVGIMVSIEKWCIGLSIRFYDYQIVIDIGSTQ